jgi:glycerol-3-phosphate acyltransferase PlsX
VITVALDAMGGDNGLDATVEGAASLSREPGDTFVLLVGDAPRITARLERSVYDPSRIGVAHASGCVEMSDDPREALDRLPDCSISVAARLVRDGEAQALVSAGHTGATILASARHFQRLSGVRRAALAAVYPTEQRHGPRQDPFALMLDVGATLDADAEDLVSFATMGSVYSSIVSEIPEPRVALLSNGTEPNKGTRAIVGAHALLRQSPIHFAGNVEGIDIPRGTVDVVVCDGFLGNVVLKMLEGVSDVVKDVARQASSRRLQWALGLAMLGGGIQEIKRLTDWKVYGGAPLLGFDRVVIKAHGRSESRAIRNALKVGAKTVKGGLVARIERDLVRLSTSRPDPA